MYVRQDGKFSSNLLLLLISRTYQHDLKSGKSWGHAYRIYTTLSLCSHFGSSLSSLDIHRSTSRLFLRELVAAQHQLVFVLFCLASISSHLCNPVSRLHPPIDRLLHRFEMSSNIARLLLAFFLSTIALALPAPRTTSAQNTVPLNGLPAPGALNLKYITLGVGTQNYSCSAKGAVPVAIGAVADLYDASLLLSPAKSSLIPSFAAVAYSTHTWFGLPTLGHHWFSASGVPTFDLESRGFLSAKKVASVPAPSGSISPSVDWLFLQDDGRGVSKNLQAVYRVETAGGSAPATCSSAGVIKVPYAAEYWFYG